MSNQTLPHLDGTEPRHYDTHPLFVLNHSDIRHLAESAEDLALSMHRESELDDTPLGRRLAIALYCACEAGVTPQRLAGVFLRWGAIHARLRRSEPLSRAMKLLARVMDEHMATAFTDEDKELYDLSAEELMTEIVRQQSGVGLPDEQSAYVLAGLVQPLVDPHPYFEPVDVWRWSHTLTRDLRIAAEKVGRAAIVPTAREAAEVATEVLFR